MVSWMLSLGKLWKTGKQKTHQQPWHFSVASVRLRAQLGNWQEPWVMPKKNGSQTWCVVAVEQLVLKIGPLWLPIVRPNNPSMWVVSGNSTWQIENPKTKWRFHWQKHRTKWWILQPCLISEGYLLVFLKWGDPQTIPKHPKTMGFQKNDIVNWSTWRAWGYPPFFGAQRKMRRFRPTLPCGACDLDDLGRGLAVDLPYAIYDICMETYGIHTQR